MKAAYIDEFGGPEAIRFGEMPKPAPRANEVLVRNQIIGIGKPDALVRSGNDPYLASKFPGLIIGNESAGIVEAVGSEVKNIKVGDKVAVLNGTGCGSHAEYSCAGEDFVIHTNNNSCVKFVLCRSREDNFLRPIREVSL